MEKYNGNQKGFIYVSCDDVNQKEIIEKYLEPLAKDGISFWWADSFDSKEEKKLVRASAALFFLTNDYVKEAKLRDTITSSVKNNKPVLCVYLEDVELDAALSMQTEAQQALFVNKYKDDEEFVGELRKAAIFDNIQLTKKQKSIQRNRTLAAVVVAAAVLVAAIIIIRPMLESDANEETMSALGLQGVSQEELESIEELHVVGTEVVDFDIAKTRYDEDDAATILYERNDEEYWGVELTTTPGTITDLSGLEKLKNLRILQIEGQQIEDISPVLKLNNLEQLSLSCNPISSVDGVEKLPNLQRLDINNTNVSELPDDLHVQDLRTWNTPLTSVPDFGGLSDVYFDANNTMLTDFSNLSTASSYDALLISKDFGDAVPHASITDNLKGKMFRQFIVYDLGIDSFEDLSGFDVSEELAIPWSTITSLDGIEHFEGIQYLNLTDCSGLTDLSPVNKLKSLEHLYISEDMAGMADQVDDRIEVIFE